MTVLLNGVNVDTDNPDLMYEGWKTVEKMAKKICWDHINTYGLRNGMEFEDLMQQAYLTYDRVMKSYDETISNDLINYLYCSIRDHLKTLYVIRDRSRMLDECDSYNVPANKEEEYGETEENYLYGGNAREEAESNLEREDLKTTLATIFSNLDDNDHEAIMKLLRGEKIDSKTRKQALKAARMAILAATDEQKETLRDYLPFI